MSVEQKQTVDQVATHPRVNSLDSSVKNVMLSGGQLVTLRGAGVPVGSDEEGVTVWLGSGMASIQLVVSYLRERESITNFFKYAHINIFS